MSPEGIKERPHVNKVRRDLESPRLKVLVRTDGTDRIVDGALAFSVAYASPEPPWGAAAGLGSGVLQWIRRHASPSGLGLLVRELRYTRQQETHQMLERKPKFHHVP